MRERALKQRRASAASININVTGTFYRKALTPITHIHSLRSPYFIVAPFTTSRSVQRAEAQNQLLLGQLGESAKQKAALAQKSAKKLIQNLINKCLTSTLNAWIKFTKEEKENRTKVKRFVAKIIFAAAAKCFVEWKEFLVEKKKNANIVMKFSARMKNSTVVRIVQTWNQYVAPCRASEARERKLRTPAGATTRHFQTPRRRHHTV